MATILRVYNEDNIKYDLDLFQDQDFILEISAKEAGEVPSIFGVSSQTIAVPATDKNNQYFGNLWDLHATAGNKFTRTYPCQVLENGDEIFDGRLFLQNIVTDQRGDTVYNVLVVDEVIDFKTQVNNLTWNEVFAFYTGSSTVPVPQPNAGWNHTLNFSNVSSSWDLELPQIGIGPPPIQNFGLPREGDIVYPLIDYGQEENSGKTAFANFGLSNTFTNTASPLKLDQLKPSIRLSAMWKALMRFIGYEYESDFINSDYFNTIYYLTTTDETTGATTDAPIDGLFYASSSANQILNPNIPDTLLFQDEIYDNSSNWDITTSEYTAPAPGEYGFQFSIPYEILNFTGGGPIREVRFALYRNGVADTRYPPIIYSSLNSSTGTFTGNFPTVSLRGGDTITLRASFLNRTSGTPEQLQLKQGSYFQCYSSPQTIINGDVNMSLNFGDETVVDWLEGIIQKFNLVITPIRDQKNKLLVEPFDQWKTKGDIVDWTDIVDRSVKFDIRHPLQDQPKSIMFSDEEDEDEANKYSIEKLGKIYGSVEYRSDSDIIEGEDAIGKYFAPTPMKYIDGTNTFIIPQIYSVDNGIKQPIKFKPRLLHYVNSNGLFATPEPATGLIGIDGITITTGEWYLQDEIGNTRDMTAYPQFHHINELPADANWNTATNPSTTKDLHFGNRGHWSYHQDYVNAQTYRDALYEYWQGYLAELYSDSARLLTCNVVLNPTTINQIQLNDRIFIDGAYYRINKIPAANLTTEQSTEVELLKESTRTNKYQKRRINKVIGDNGGDKTGGGGGDIFDPDDYSEDIIIGGESSNGKIVYEDYNTGEVIDDYDKIVQAAQKDGVQVSPSGAYWHNTATSQPTTNQSLGSNYIDKRNNNTIAIGYGNEVISYQDSNLILGDNNTTQASTGKNLINGNNITINESNDVSILHQLTSSVVVTSSANSVILNPIYDVGYYPAQQSTTSSLGYSQSVWFDSSSVLFVDQTGSTYNGNLINQGYAEFRDDINVFGDIILNGENITGSIQQDVSYLSAYSTINQDLLLISTPQQITFNNVRDSSSISISTFDDSTITLDKAGKYNIDLTLQMQKRISGSINPDVYIWFNKQGVDIPYSSNRATLVGGINRGNIITVSQYVETTADNQYIVALWASSQPTARIGITTPPVGPNVASAQINITQIT